MKWFRPLALCLLMPLSLHASDKTMGNRLILEKHFGEWTAEGLVETNQIPLSPARDYGWEIRLNPANNQPVQVEEIFTLPDVPDTWGPEEATGRVKVSADRKTATTRMRLQPENGWISHAWSTAPGDPVGEYRIQVKIQGSDAADFRFQVTPSAEQ